MFGALDLFDVDGLYHSLILLGVKLAAIPMFRGHIPARTRGLLLAYRENRDMPRCMNSLTRIHIVA